MVQYYGTGRRKTSIARVRLIPGKGEINVNGQSLEEYFAKKTLEVLILEPLKITNTEGKFDVLAKVEGGGYTGQAGAIRLGISRALLEVDPEYRPILKRAGFLTHDSRMKERVKYGLKGARRAPQYSKR